MANSPRLKLLQWSADLVLMAPTGERQPSAPIGALAELSPVVAEHRVSSPSDFDVARLILGHADNNETVELVSLSEHSRWFGLRQEVRFRVKGAAWDVARFWDDIQEGLPRGGGFNPFGLLDWWW